MEFVALASHLLLIGIAVQAVHCCWTLYRQLRTPAFLFLGAIFCEPLALMVMRGLNGLPLIPYRTQALGADGSSVVEIKMALPLFFYLGVIGLFILRRAFKPPASKEPGVSSARPDGA